MKNCFRTVLIASVIAISAIVSQATVLRAYVASTGSDANVGVNCPQASPCKTFAAAFPVVTSGGELIALDSAGYGGIPNINKAITIAAVPGAHAFIVVPAGTNGMAINISISHEVTLRNLHFNGTGTSGSTGVLVNPGGPVHIENCIFTGLDKGIYYVYATNMTVTDSTIRDVKTGIHLEPPYSDSKLAAKIAVEHCRIENYVNGLVAAGYHSIVSIRDSQFVGKGKEDSRGITSKIELAGTTHMMIENSLLSNNLVAIGSDSDGAARFSLSQNVIFANYLAVSSSGQSKIISFGNNRFEYNTNDGLIDVLRAFQ